MTARPRVEALRAKPRDQFHARLVDDLGTIAGDLREAAEAGETDRLLHFTEELIAAAGDLATENQNLNEMLQELWFTGWDKGYAQARDDAKSGMLAMKPKPAPAAKPSPQVSLFDLVPS